MLHGNCLNNVNEQKSVTHDTKHMILNRISLDFEPLDKENKKFVKWETVHFLYCLYFVAFLRQNSYRIIEKEYTSCSSTILYTVL